MIQTVNSKSGKPIRLNSERWNHISEEHGELAGMKEAVLEAVSNPQMIYQGNGGELLAIRPVAANRYMIVAYREGEADGFIITAFMTSRVQYLQRRKRLWP